MVPHKRYRPSGRQFLQRLDFAGTRRRSGLAMRTAKSPRVAACCLRLFAGSIGKRLALSRFPNLQKLIRRFLLRLEWRRQATECPELAICYLSTRMR